MYKKMTAFINNSCAYNAGYSFGGPVLSSYIDWLLRECQQMDINRLYFISRDGYILKQIADAIIENKRLSIYTQYIYGSRKAWRFASYNGKEGFLRMLMSYSSPERIKSVKELESVMGVPDGFLNKYTKEYIKEHCTENGTFMIATLSPLIAILDQDAGFREQLMRELDEKKELASAYLQQEVDYSDDHFAFVDLNGFGITQVCVAQLMKAYYTNSIKSFYFTLYRNEYLSNCSFYSFIKPKRSLTDIIEKCARAPHGQTAGYQIKNGKYIPVLDSDRETEIMEYNYADYLNGVSEFLRNYLRENNSGGRTIEDADYCEKKILDFISVPSEEYSYLQNLPFNSSGREDECCCDNPWERFPFYKYGDRFVLYGAGQIGKKVYSAMKKQQLYLRLWIDKNAANVKEEGADKICTINEYRLIKNECVIIAIKDVGVCEEVKHLFLMKGVAEDRILNLGMLMGYLNPEQSNDVA